MASRMAILTYNPAMFRVPDEETARRIILTPDGEQSTAERWERETPYLTDLLGPLVQAGPGATIVDLGCGIGRMSKALIERFGCRVLGVDISPDMRAFAAGYVDSEAFSVVSTEKFAALAAGGLQVDGAISVWVLQHCLSAHEEVARLRSVLGPGARLGVVNTIGRVVPTVEKTWASDGVDVRGLLNETFAAVQEGDLDAGVVGDVVAHGTFWGVYEKA